MSDPERAESVLSILKALGDPVRWEILAHVAQVDEFPCASLEDILSVSKPTISYHVKILQQAGLISVRKSGRSNYYAVHREAIDAVIGALHGLAVSPGVGSDVANTQPHAPAAGLPEDRPERPTVVPNAVGESAVLTW